jgi:hypothetical protein
MIEDWSTITILALQATWRGFLIFLPKLIGSIIVFVIGWFFATGAGRFIAEVLRKLKFNQIFERSGWKEALEKAEFKVSPADFIGGVCKWILVIVFLLASVEILGFVQFADFLTGVLNWLPNLMVALAIFVVAIIVTDILEKVVRAGVKKMDIGYSGFLGVAAKWAVYIFAVLAILLQLKITPSIIDTLVKGFVGMFALAFGLSFGLGGKDAAAKFIEDFKKKIS